MFLQKQIHTSQVELTSHSKHLFSYLTLIVQIFESVIKQKHSCPDMHQGHLPCTFPNIISPSSTPQTFISNFCLIYKVSNISLDGFFLLPLLLSILLSFLSLSDSLSSMLFNNYLLVIPMQCLDCNYIIASFCPRLNHFKLNCCAQYR